MVDIDDGSIHNVSYDDIRILYKPFSQLPAQSFTCYLNGIESVDKNVLTQIVDKKCIVHIISIEQLNKVIIKQFCFDLKSNYHQHKLE